jgi:hypothetical protein
MSAAKIFAVHREFFGKWLILQNKLLPKILCEIIFAAQATSAARRGEFH